MNAALRAIESGSAVSINKVARDHGIPPTTLKDRLSGRVVDGTKPGRPSYLTSQEESELESYLIESCKLGYGKTRRQVKAIVENVAIDKGILRKSHISDGWWKKFLARHPKLSLRSGDATGHVRMKATTRENLTHYFDLLNKCLEEHDFKDHPERIYNMDESGIPLDPKPPKVLAVKGQKKVRYRCSGNKSQITVLGCCSGTGQAMPPFIIFEGKQLNYLWTCGEVPGTRYGVSDSGWTNKSLFYGWLVEHFLVHAVQGRPLLLLVDGHSSHFDPEAIRFAKDHSVIIFCLPPHTTHEAQPLDISFFGPLKTNWGHVCHDFIQSSPGKVVTKLNFSELFAKAWMKTCTPDTICAGFRRAGIIPFNPEAVKERFPEEESMEVSTNSCESMEVSTNSSQDVAVGDKSSTSVLNKDLKDIPVFSSEEEDLFSRRFEEGYDLHDSCYEQWLHVTHPQVLMTESVIDSFKDVEPFIPLASVSSPAAVSKTPPTSTYSSMFQTPPSSSSSKSTFSFHSSSSSSAIPDGSSSSSSPLALETPPTNTSPAMFSLPTPPVPETPPTNSVSPCSPHALLQRRSPLAPVINCSPNLHSGTATSPLSRYIQPIPRGTKSTGKMGCAKVLTSTKCLQLLEEKKRKKEKEAEEKEERRNERKRRKIEREELQKKKKEERLEHQRKKQEEARRKQPVMRRRGRPKGNCSNPSSKSGSLSGCDAETPTRCTTSVEFTQQEDQGNWECAFCYGSYCTDGEEWVKCACNLWVHEKCIEDVYLDENCEERFCPFCLN